MFDLNTHIRIGSCSWKYDSWKGIVYPETVGDNYLSEYSRHYNTVEVDQWFWSLFGDNIVLPKPDVVKDYVSSVPEDFKFTIKVPNAITLTHPYAKQAEQPLSQNHHFLSIRLFEDFLALLEPMKQNIGAFIFQFEYLNKQKMSNQQTFLDMLGAFLKKCPTGYEYAVEIRNQNYLNKNYFQFVETLGLTHVFLQGYWMPPIVSLYNRFKNHIKKSTIIRLHGPDRKEIENKTKSKWNQIVEPKDGEIQQIAGMINELVSRDVRVTVNVNNHYEGSAPLTIKKIYDALVI